MDSTQPLNGPVISAHPAIPSIRFLYSQIFPKLEKSKAINAGMVKEHAMEISAIVGSAPQR